MQCPTIEGIVFDSRSLEGIKRIRQINDFSKALEKSLIGGTLATIFVSSGPLQSSYTILSTDWEKLARAVGSISAIERNRVQQEASIQIMDHANNPKQRRFWRAVYDGCSIL